MTKRSWVRFQLSPIFFHHVLPNKKICLVSVNLKIIEMERPHFRPICQPLPNLLWICTSLHSNNLHSRNRHSNNLQASFWAIWCIEISTDMSILTFGWKSNWFYCQKSGVCITSPALNMNFYLAILLYTRQNWNIICFWLIHKKIYLSLYEHNM